VRRLLQISLVPHSPDLALLVLRVWIGTSLFLKHGLGKLFGNSEMITHFPDPLHIGTYASFAVSTVSDGLGSSFLPMERQRLVFLLCEDKALGSGRDLASPRCSFFSTALARSLSAKFFFGCRGFTDVQFSLHDESSWLGVRDGSRNRLVTAA
jgi:hypothetical protein